MKKFFACVFIMILFGLFCFFTGWTQIKVPSDTTGIVISKLKGVDDNVVQRGKYTFHKAFLLPSNARLLKFKINPYNSETTIKGILPSGDILKGSTSYDFSYSFTISTEIHMEPETLLELVKDNTVTDQASLENYMKVLSESIAQETAGFYLKNLEDNAAFIPETVSIVDLYKKCRFNEKYPDIQIDAIALKESRIPDYELYKIIRSTFISDKSRLSDEVTE